MSDLSTFLTSALPRPATPQTAHVLRSAATSVSSGQVIDLVSLTLVAGTYDMNMMVGVIFTGTPSFMEWGASINSGTIIGTDQSDVPGGNGNPGETRHGQSLASTDTQGTFTTPTYRFTITGTTTFYLVTYFIFAGGTTSVFGSMTATPSH